MFNTPPYIESKTLIKLILFDPHFRGGLIQKKKTSSFFIFYHSEWLICINKIMYIQSRFTKNECFVMRVEGDWKKKIKTISQKLDIPMSVFIRKIVNHHVNKFL